MLKKIIAVSAVVACAVGGWYGWQSYKVGHTTSEASEPAQKAEQQQTFDDSVIYAYQADSLSENCTIDSAMGCAVDFAVKCTINPDYKGCRDSKLPRFIFMTDESLQRPTEMSFRIVKIKPISADLVEIHTDSTCNGNWFGLCQGRVIYVLVPTDDAWRVKDIYAIERL